MKSPFPGMDPYLEQYWRDVHRSLCVYASDALQPQLRPDLVARLDERLVADPDADLNLPKSRRASFKSDPAYEGFVQIFDVSEPRPLITNIEFLTLPTKLSKQARLDYQNARERAVESGVNFVEIDLLRAGDWVLPFPKERLPVQADVPYRVCICLAEEKGRCEFYPIQIKNRLPKVGIPLHGRRERAILDLQELIGRAYMHGAYDVIDYNVPADPPLDKETKVWLKKLLLEREMN